MRPLIILILGLIGLATWPCLAQNTPPANPPVRIAGTVDKLDGDALTVVASDGQKTMVTLAADAKVYGVEKRTVADIKPGDFVASGGVKGTDGKIHAVEVRIFPEPLRGTGEGQRPWSVKPEGVMTNATGHGDPICRWRRHPVTYKGGNLNISFGPDVPVLLMLWPTTPLKPGGCADLCPEATDGTLTTARVTAGKDDVKPPM